jgi:predicted rRNA methylase YqxC with S4 and FtsJ domains
LALLKDSVEYLAFVDSRFERDAEREIKILFPGAKYRLYLNNQGLTLFSIQTEKKITSKPDNKNSFIDFLLEVDAKIENIGEDYEKISEKIAEVVAQHKNKSFKLEVKKVDATIKGRAKDIEVKIGKAIEEKGFKADLKNPDFILYLVFRKNNLFICHSYIDGKNIVLDHFRLEKKDIPDSINRSEFKLKEAVEFFDIDLKEIKKCLDIGSSPGGWVHYLAEKNVKVVGVDITPLDYEKLAGKKLLIFDNIKEIENKNTDYEIVHLQMQLKEDNISVLKPFAPFDMLTIDVNVDPLKSAEMANSLSSYLAKKCILIMTIKMVDRSFSVHVEKVKNILSKNYNIIAIKKLPHNRRELTLYAIFKDSGGP